MKKTDKIQKQMNSRRIPIRQYQQQKPMEVIQ